MGCARAAFLAAGLTAGVVAEDAVAAATDFFSPAGFAVGDFSAAALFTAGLVEAWGAFCEAAFLGAAALAT